MLSASCQPTVVAHGKMLPSHNPTMSSARPPAPESLRTPSMPTRVLRFSSMPSLVPPSMPPSGSPPGSPPGKVRMGQQRVSSPAMRTTSPSPRGAHAPPPFAYVRMEQHRVSSPAMRTTSACPQGAHAPPPGGYFTTFQPSRSPERFSRAPDPGKTHTDEAAALQKSAAVTVYEPMGRTEGFDEVAVLRKKVDVLYERMDRMDDLIETPGWHTNAFMKMFDLFQGKCEDAHKECTELRQLLEKKPDIPGREEFPLCEHMREDVSRECTELHRLLEKEHDERSASVNQLAACLQEECNCRADEIRTIAKSLQLECDVRTSEVQHLADSIQADRERRMEDMDKVKEAVRLELSHWTLSGGVSPRTASRLSSEGHPQESKTAARKESSVTLDSMITTDSSSTTDSGKEDGIHRAKFVHENLENEKFENV